MRSPRSTGFNLHLGIKTGSIEYRYSWDWLFRILAEEDIRYVQIGTFFEIYQLRILRWSHYVKKLKDTVFKSPAYLRSIGAWRFLSWRSGLGRCGFSQF